MQRTKFRWKKIGGGTFRIGNRVIKPNQVFVASPSEIPESFRNVVITLDDLSESVEAEVGKIKFQIVEEKTEEIQPEQEQEDVDQEEVCENNQYVIEDATRGWYNVINTVTRKQVNERKLRKVDAEGLLQDLMS